MTEKKENAVDLSLLEGVLGGYDESRDNLISILWSTQKLYGYLPEPALLRIAERTGCPPAAVMGVSSFYTQFRMTPVGKYLILLCKGTACHVSGVGAVETAMRAYLELPNDGTTADGLFTLEGVACIGCCCLAPAMMINGKTYGHLTPGYAVGILRELRAKEEAQ